MVTGHTNRAKIIYHNMTITSTVSTFIKRKLGTNS